MNRRQRRNIQFRPKMVAELIRRTASPRFANTPGSSISINYNDIGKGKASKGLNRVRFIGTPSTEQEK